MEGLGEPIIAQPCLAPVQCVLRLARGLCPGAPGFPTAPPANKQSHTRTNHATTNCHQPPSGAGQALLDRASGQRSSTPSDAGGSVMVWVDIFCSAAAVSVAAAGGPPPLTRALGGSIRLSSAGMTGPTGASAGGAAAPSKDVLAMQAVREVRKAVGLTDGTLLCLDGAGQVLSRLWVQVGGCPAKSLHLHVFSNSLPQATTVIPHIGRELCPRWRISLLFCTQH